MAEKKARRLAEAARVAHEELQERQRLFGAHAALGARMTCLVRALERERPIRRRKKVTAACMLLSRTFRRMLERRARVRNADLCATFCKDVRRCLRLRKAMCVESLVR
jgi:hypothetical protein